MCHSFPPVTYGAESDRDKERDFYAGNPPLSYLIKSVLINFHEQTLFIKFFLLLFFNFLFTLSQIIIIKSYPSPEMQKKECTIKMYFTW